MISYESYLYIKILKLLFIIFLNKIEMRLEISAGNWRIFKLNSLQNDDWNLFSFYFGEWINA